MSCHGGTVGFRDVLGEYFKQSSNEKRSAYRPISFSAWLKDNYSVYSVETLNTSHSDASKTGGDDYSAASQEFPDQTREWGKISHMSQYGKGEQKREAILLTSDYVSSAYSDFITNSADRSGVDSFLDYASNYMKSSSESSQLSLNLFNIFRKKKTPEEVALEKQVAAKKKETEEAIRMKKNETKKKEQMLDLELKKAQTELEETKKQDLTEKFKKKQKEEAEKKLQEWKEKQAAEKEANTPSEAKKAPSIPVYAWGESDVVLVFELLTSPETLTVEKAKKVASFIDNVVEKNVFLKTRLDSVKDKIGLVGEEYVCKMLSVVKSFPDHWETNKAKVAKTRYTGTDKDWKRVQDFTISDYYQVYLAYNQICQGKKYEELTGHKAQSVKTPMLAKLKEKIGLEEKKTIDWDDQLVKALKTNVENNLEGVDVDLLNRLNPFVKQLCKNKELGSINDQVKSYLSKHKYPPTTDEGVIVMASICKYNPVVGKNGEMMSQFVMEGEEDKLLLSEMATKELNPIDRVKAYNVYQRLLQVRKPGYFPFDSRVLQTEPSAVKKSEFQPELELEDQDMVLLECIKSISDDKFTRRSLKYSEEVVTDVVKHMHKDMRHKDEKEKISELLTAYLQWKLAKVLENPDAEEVFVTPIDVDIPMLNEGVAFAIENTDR